MIQDTRPDRLPPESIQTIDNWLFKDRESLEQRFGMELERIKELYETDVGKRELLQKMKQSDPSLNGNVNAALDQVNQNIEVLEKKESFLTKMLKLPVRAVEAVGRTMKRHKLLTAGVGIAALIALLYFTTPLAPVAGEYGQQLIESFKTVMSRLHIATPETAMEAVGSVPVTGGSVGEAAAAAATEAFQSPSTMMQAGQELLGAAADPSVAAEAVQQISPAAEQIFQSGTQALEGMKSATDIVSPEILDPLQRAIQGLPPIE